jgi:hypothetical protein
MMIYTLNLAGTRNANAIDGNGKAYDKNKLSDKERGCI